MSRTDATAQTAAAQTPPQTLTRPGPAGGELSVEALEHRRARLRGRLERTRARSRPVD